MKELERLKRRLLKQEPSEQEQIYNLCAVMEICGGYNQLLDLSLPTLDYILKYLEYQDKKTKESMPKIPHIRKPHR